MTDYSKLVEALRETATFEYTGKLLSKRECALENLAMDAAAAIEALQALLGEAENSVERWKDMYLTKHEPKRGKWITIRLNNGGSYTGCSCCEAPIPTDTMLDYIPESESKYCYSCGAKMEVQDA